MLKQNYTENVPSLNTQNMVKGNTGGYMKEDEK